MGVSRFDVFLVNLDPTVDKARLGRRLGALEAREAAAVLDGLREFFAP